MARGVVASNPHNDIPDGAKANGDPPVSTIAAQIVNKLSDASGQAVPGYRKEFDQLLLEILSTEDAASERGAVETDLKVIYKLVYVVTRAGLQVLLRDDPFANSEQLLGQAQNSLAVIELTVERNPEVLFFHFQDTVEAEGKSYPVLFLWLLPKLLALLGHRNAENLHADLMRILSTFLVVTLRTPEVWLSGATLLKYYRDCINILLVKFEESRNVQGLYEAYSVTLPASHDVVEALPIVGAPTLSSECQIIVREPIHGMLIMLRLIVVISNSIQSPIWDSLAVSVMRNDHTSLLDNLRRCWIDLERIRSHRSLQQDSRDILAIYLQVLQHTSFCILANTQSKVQLKTAAQLLARIVTKVLQLGHRELESSTQMQLSLILLKIMQQMSRDSNVMPEAAKEHLTSFILELRCDPTWFNHLTSDLRHVIDLWSTMVQLGNESADALAAPNHESEEIQFTEPQLQDMFEPLRRLSLSDREAGTSRPRKRQRFLSPSKTDGDNSMTTELIRELYGLLGSQDVNDLVGLNTIAVSCYTKLSEQDQCKALDCAGLLFCAGFGTLTYQRDISGRIPSRHCSFCDSHADLKQPRPLAIWDESQSEEVLLTLTKLFKTPVFQESKRPRVRAMLTIRRIANHIVDKSHLDLAHSVIGQWCLQSQRSSLRELRIAAGRTLPAFIRHDLGDDILRSNRILVLDYLRTISERNEITLQETCVLVWGRVARVCEDDELNIVLLRLVQYLGHTSSFICGLAYNELDSLSHSFDLTPRALLNPFWRSIGITVIRDLQIRPQTAQLLSDLLGTTVSELLVITQASTLPYLILLKKQDIIQRIAWACGKGTTILSMCFEKQNLAAILALLLVQQSTDVESITMALLCEASPDFKNYDLTDLIKTEPIVTVFELLKAAGSDDESKRPRTHQAIQLVAALDSRKAGHTRGSSGRSAVVGPFFEKFVLGIMGEFSETINGVRGPQSTFEKKRCLRGIEEMIKIGKSHVSNALPQICACLQSAIEIEFLCDQALSTWATLITTLEEEEIAPLLEQTFSIVVQNWERLRSDTQQCAHAMIAYLLKKHTSLIRDAVVTIPSLASIPLMSKFEADLAKLKSQLDVRHHYQAFSRRCQHENITVVTQALNELVIYLQANQFFLHEAARNEQPEPVLAQLTRSVLDACIKFDDMNSRVPTLSAQCLGLIGCLDPNRIEATRDKDEILVLSNFEKADETVSFVIFFIQEILVKVFLSASNTKSQGFLAYAMQELLKFCELDTTSTFRSRDAQSNVNYRRWISLPETVRNTLTPFLTSRYTLTVNVAYTECQYPIFTSRLSHGPWLRTFVLDLLHKATGDNARMIFPVCSRVIRAQDIAIATFLFPFAALNVIIGGTETNRQDIGKELLAVLNHQLLGNAHMEKENLKLCSESVFHVLDYLSRWMQEKRKQMAITKNMLARTGQVPSEIDQEIDQAQLQSVEQVLALIPAQVISRRAIECQSYARALFHWEQYIRQERRKTIAEGQDHLEPLLERLQDIYTQIDEPDGIEGISAHLHVLNIDQQILEHRKAGRWTAAQSWYEMQLVDRPDDIDIQVNLLTCLKESGQHDVLLNQIEGLQQSETTISKLLPFAVEASWATGKWKVLEKYLRKYSGGLEGDFNIGIGQILLALHSKDRGRVLNLLDQLRKHIATGLSDTTTASFQACHDSLLKFHILSEVESISGISSVGEAATQPLLALLDRRLQVLGSFLSDKQYLLGLRRAAMQLSSIEFTSRDLASLWLTSARLARKGNFIHQAFNAVLHASQLGDESATIEHSRLLWKEGHHRKAIQSLQGSIAANAFISHNYVPNDESTGLLAEDKQQQQNLLTGRAHLLLAKWLDTAGQTQSHIIIKEYRTALASYNRWEKGHYYLGKHYNKLLESEKTVPPAKRAFSFITGESTKLVIESYVRSLAFGSKYMFQTLPRVLTLWLDLGSEIDQPIDLEYGNDEDFRARAFAQRKKSLGYIHRQLEKYIDQLPAYVFYTALSQIVARICHSNQTVKAILINMIVKVVSTHPQQALWTLLAVVKSSNKERAARGMECLTKINKRSKADATSSDLKSLINQGHRLSDQLLHVCEGDIQGKPSIISLTKDLAFNHKTTPCRLVIPLESTLTATLPAASDTLNKKSYKAFSQETVMISAFLDDVLVLSSLQRPRKISIRGSNGQVYGLLCKPKDDLRKDQRLMEFNTMINRSLKRDAESSKRRLYIKTYAVTPLNEECGIIEWVDGLKTIRDILLKLYKERNVTINYQELRILLEEACAHEDKLPIFTKKILPTFPPVLHQWFVDMFPEPSAWFTARLRYTRSCAVMSMVGHVLGLGDRHGENILLEEGNGGTFHVDFNCLFDKGLTFEKPEMVPFRLTHNMVDAFGAYGYEGPYRKSCELTMGILRQNEDTLMTILETFLYDPTTDFIGKKKKSSNNSVPDTPHEVLEAVRNKVRGLLKGESVPLSVEGQVHELIQQAVSPMNLASMYIGWCAFF
ncbi:MAG: serine/threonine-protein kinase M1 [Pycnora praestabilis]|nr:MAG: serine/threonine-protein kinase M1 [Pycnora praestabilis]